MGKLGYPIWFYLVFILGFACLLFLVAGLLVVLAFVLWRLMMRGRTGEDGRAAIVSEAREAQAEGTVPPLLTSGGNEARKEIGRLREYRDVPASPGAVSGKREKNRI